jgi:putative exporter of polyketide antibiotics
MNWVAFSAVTAVAVALGAVGLVGLRRRDLQPS